MKKGHVLSISLLLLVILSLVLNYFLLYDTNALNRIIGEETTPPNEIIDDDTTQYSVVDFYENTSLSFSNVIDPTSIIYRKSDSIFQITNEQALQTLEAYLTSRPIEVSNVGQTSDESLYYALFEGDYIEVNYSALLPVGTYSNIIDMDESQGDAFRMNQLIIPLEDESSSIYLANSLDRTFIRGDLDNQLSKEELTQFIEDSDDTFIPVERYIGKNRYIYLPIDPITMRSELFTLEILPENLYVSQMFPDGSDFSINESEEGNTIFRNFQYNLEIDREQQRLDYVINRIDQGEPRTNTQKVVNSFTPITDYEYWQGDLRIARYVNNVVTYRRFLNGLPIYASPGLVDYGGTFVHLRNDQSGDVYRYQTPLVIFNAYIHDLSQTYELETGEEIMAIFNEYGYTLTEFDRVMIGYEWQSDMEDFKKAILVPKWYFEFNNQIYSIDQLQSESFQQIWSNASDTSEGEGE